MTKFTWLFSENLSKTMDNNSWYFFEHIVIKCQQQGIESYFVIVKNKANIKKLKNLNRSIRRRIVWRDSLRHQILYWRADMYYVTLSYRDILPNIYRGVHRNKKPLVYLQHGTTGIKKVGYSGNSYHNTMFRFIDYSPAGAKLLVEENDFSEYQIEYSPALPRYKGLVRLNEQYETEPSKQILWFLTWREYLNGESNQDKFIPKIQEVVNDEKLLKYLKHEGRELKVCLHAKFDIEKFRSILEPKADDNISFVHADNVDVIEEIAKSEFLITDYSSIGFDFTFLNKPVLVYQFDSVMYGIERGFYCDLEKDFTGSRAINKDELVSQIINKYKKLNSFFADRIDTTINLDEVKAGKYIDELYEKYLWAQQNKVTLLGYNFYGRGGTVTATKALAEGLAERGYMVDLLCLRRGANKPQVPNGVIVRSLMGHGHSLVESMKYRLFKGEKMMSYLSRDISKQHLIPYAGFALKRYLKKTKSKTVVSTRETLHLFLKEAENSRIKNKVYYFHTAAMSMNSIFPGILDLLKQARLEKAAFVSDTDRNNYAEVYKYAGYDEFVTTGDGLQSYEVVKPTAIKPPGKKTAYKGVTLTRIAKDRQSGVNNIIKFGRYLKEHNITNIELDIFGAGDIVFDFCEQIDRYGLAHIIRYRGLTNEPQKEIRQHDFVVDFSENHSFGMVYIEAILNGAKCFARSNAGSREVFKGITGAIYKTEKELAGMLSGLPKITKNELVANYELVNNRFGRGRVTKKFLKLVDE